MSIRENITLLEVKLVELKTHHICAKFEETETHYKIIFPQGFRIDGAQATKSMGKLLACSRLIEVMEREWLATLPNCAVLAA